MSHASSAHSNVAVAAESAGPVEPVERAEVSVRLVVPALAENIGLIRHALGGVGSVLRLDAERISAIRLAVTEACTNVVRHAYGEGSGPLEVHVRTGARLLEVDVRDRGMGIAPRPAEDSLGWGLPLIAALADRLRIARERDGANVVAMAFRR